MVLDEFLLGWVLILKNGRTDVWKVILYLLYDFFTTWNILKIWTFQKICRKKNSKFQFWKKFKIDENKCAWMFQWVGNDHISFQTKNGTVELRFHDHPQKIPKKSQNSIFQVPTFSTESSSGWVPIIRKVLPFKSMSSGEYFSYISCGHIFNRSKDIQFSLKKTTPVVSYVQTHHMIISIPTGDKLIWLVLRGGYNVQPVPPSNSLYIDKNIVTYDKGIIMIDILLTLGYATSGAPNNMGIKIFPNNPINPGIIKKKIINNPCKVILRL